MNFILLLVLPLFADEIKGRYELSPLDYYPNGRHFEIMQPLVNRNCFENTDKLSFSQLKMCIAALRDGALKTTSLQGKLSDYSLDSVFSLFGKTGAPSDWDIHAPTLKVITDRLSGESSSLTNGRKDIINVGLWLSASQRILELSKRLREIAPGKHFHLVNTLSEVSSAGANFLRTVRYADDRGRPSIDKMNQLFAEAQKSAKNIHRSVANNHTRLKSDFYNYNFLKSVESSSKEVFEGSVDVQYLMSCTSQVREEDDILEPTIPIDSKELNNSIWKYMPKEFLAAMKFAPNQRFRLCYDEHRWVHESNVRKNGDDKGWFDYIAGRYVVGIKGYQIDASGEHLAFHVRVFCPETAVRFAVAHFEKKDGETKTMWINYNNELPRKLLLSNGALLDRWRPSHSHSMMKEFINGKGIHNESKDENVKIAENGAHFLKIAESKRTEMLEKFRSWALDSIKANNLTDVFDGVSRSMRTYALLIAPETRKSDPTMDALITDNKLSPELGYRSMLNRFEGELAFLDTVATDGGDSLLTRLKSIHEIVLQRTAPELAPQKLTDVAQMIEKLDATRVESKAEMPKIAIEEALKSLQSSIFKNLSDLGAKP